MFFKRKKKEEPKQGKYTGPLTINARPPKKYTINITHEAKVAGISHHQDTLNNLIDGRGKQIILERDPTNKHDANAIKVMGRWIDENDVEHIAQVGHVPAAIANQIAGKYPNNELRGCLSIIHQPQPDKSGGMVFRIYAAPL